MLVVGALALLAGGGFGGVKGWAWASGFDWNTIKPDWWLRADLGRGPAAEDAALKELTSRLGAGSLGPATAAAVGEEALARQQDPAAAWSEPWGVWLEAYRVRGGMTKEQAAAYARAAMAVRIDGRPNVSQGGMWYPRITVSGGRVASMTGLSFHMEPVWSELDGTRQRRSPAEMGGGLGKSQAASTTHPVRVDEPPGTHTYKARWRFGVHADAGPESEELVAWEEEFTLTVEALPRGTPLVALVADESLRAAMEKAVRADSLRWTKQADGSVQANGTMFIAQPPAPFAFEVFWRVPDPGAPGGFREVKVGAMHGPAGSGSSGFGYAKELPAVFDRDRVDVVLRPSVPHAETSVGLTEIWDGEIVIRDVPVAGGEK